MNIWKKYLNCKNYVDRKAIVSNADKFFDFYIGDHWKHCITDGIELPSYNFIRPTVKFKISTVCQNKVTATYTDWDNNQENKHLFEFVNKKFSEFRERGKFDVKMWGVNKDAAIYGDAYMFWGTSDPTKAQILPTGTILFGDEQCQEIQEQPYIIIRQRLRVSKVKEEAEKNGIPKDEIEAIRGSDEKDFTVGNKDNVDNSGDNSLVTAIIYLERKNGIIHMAKAVENCEYKKLTPMAQKDGNGEWVLDNAFKVYPVAHLPWERVPNSARSRGTVDGMIYNQIAVNKSLAQRGEAIKISAFPRLVYDGNAISNGEDLDVAGAVIKVNGNATQSVQQQISFLAPQPLSGDAKVYTDEIVSTTKELEGTSDTITGAIDPTRVSAAAITALRDQASQSLNENLANNNQFVEDVARIVLNIISTYMKGEETFVSSNEKGEAINVTITPDELAKIKPFIKIDVTPETALTKKSVEDWWAEQLEKARITFEEYIAGVPSGGSVPKEQAQELINKRKEKGLPDEMAEGELNGMSEMQDQPIA